MAKIMYTQKWYSINEYPLDYYELIFQYYAPFLHDTPITYYNLDLVNSVADKEVLVGGSYELMGDLSGYLWKKIVMLPVYNIEQVQFTLNSDEAGVAFSNRTTTFFIPSIYEFRPMIHDHFLWDQIAWRDDSFMASTPLYEVINVEKQSSTELTFWKITAKSTSKTKPQIEKQLSGNYSFVDYEKQIYKTSDAIALTKLMVKNSKLKVNDFFKEKVGLYLEETEQI